MKALGIVGSYRKGGINDTAVEAILQGAASKGVETEKVFLAEQTIRFCNNCRNCLQQPGADPGPCLLEDDVPGLIRRCLESNILVLSSPVNFGSMTAVTKAFLERMVCLAYWPWGTPAPQFREPSGKRLAVLVTSSAAPSVASRFGGFHALADLGKIAQVLHADVVAKLHYGLIALKRETSLSQSQRAAAIRLGSCLADLPGGGWPDKLKLRAIRAIAQSDLPQIPYVGPAFDRIASIPFRRTDK
jgi:multimeric flavodoxin WrbA